ncbi:MAG: arginine--tRNA ligase [Pseudonocardia sp.]
MSSTTAVRRSQRADFQSDGALSLAKRLGRNPREIAAAIVDASELDDLCSLVEIAGPGFINLTLRDEALARYVSQMSVDERLGVPVAEHPDRVVIDYSGPNAAKEMHVGHLRSTIIGDAAVRLLEWFGHTVIKQNHIGAWGTPFGMLIEHLLDIGEAEAAHDLSVGDLGSFYKAARQKFDSSPEFKERSRRRVVLLQGGDDQSMRLWSILVEQSKKYFLAVYDQLGVLLTDEDFAGESVYNDVLGEVIDELAERGLVQVSDGAECVFPAGFKNRDGEPFPLIVRKSDGGFGYDVTDLAAIRHRVRDLKGTRLLYVVGLPQQTHFQMVFQTARDAGWVGEAVRIEHVGHGSILGDDGKILRSRAGGSVKLIDLLTEAVARAADQVAGKNPDLPEAQAADVARSVGIGAVKYADLSTDRDKDYIFDLGRMLSFEGDTAPYLQYAHARVEAIFRKIGEQPSDHSGPVLIDAAAEHELAIVLLGFADVVTLVERSLEFHRLCGYLLGLASTFTTFYEKCPVLLAEDDDVRRSRLRLCALASRVLTTGLGLLGISAPDEM